MKKKSYIIPNIEIIFISSTSSILAASGISNTAPTRPNRAPSISGSISSTTNIGFGGSASNDAYATMSGDAKAYNGWEGLDE